jgi:hypothetical protein
LSRWEGRETREYPPEHGTRGRQIDDPVDPPEASADPMLATAPDGTVRDLRKSLPGLGPGPAANREDAVRWSTDLRQATTEALQRAGATWR